MGRVRSRRGPRYGRRLADLLGRGPQRREPDASNSKPFRLYARVSITAVAFCAASTHGRIFCIRFDHGRPCGRLRLVRVKDLSPFLSANRLYGLGVVSIYHRRFTRSNSPIALFLTMLVIFAVTTRNDVLAGVATSLLLYKPNDAVPFLVLFIILRQWRPIVVVLASTPIWYLLSVAATGDWAWPWPFYHTLATWFRWDASVDAVFSINIPGLLLSLGSSSTVAVLVGGVAFLVAMLLLLGVSRREAASIAPLLGIACSPHAYGYEALLVLPAFWLLASRPSPLRISAIVTFYCIAPLYYFARPMHFDILAIPILGTLAAWIVVRLREISARMRSPA